MFNFIDILIFLALVYLVWQGLRTGFVAGLLNLFSTIFSFVVATVFYPIIGNFLSKQFNLSQNVAFVVGFLTTLIVLELLLNFVLGFLYSKVASVYKKSKFVAEFDKYLGVLPSVGVGLFLISLLMLLVLILPVKPWLRGPIENSWWGKNVVAKGFQYQPTVERFLTRLPYKNLVYILTPASSQDEGSQTLNFPKNIQVTTDEVSEKTMLELVNKERTSRGLNVLKGANKLTQVARAHCTDMFKRSYFSHYTPEGKSPFERMDSAGIVYINAGENLAYAPSVTIAHQGLMNSTGHRENILRKEFDTLGVGVIDGGLNGKMFCQEFTN